MDISKKDWNRYVEAQAEICDVAANKMEEFLEKNSDISALFGDAANLKQWVAFRLEDRNGHIAKVPMNPITGRNAMTNNPATWGTLTQAQSAIEKFGADGIGFVFDNGYFGIDLDDVIDPAAGTIEEYALEIIDTMGTYAEISPSGRGIHIIARGNPDFPTNKNGGIEIYAPKRRLDGTLSNGRYFTVTGNPFGFPQPIAERTTAAMDVWHTFIEGKPNLPSEAVSIGSGSVVDYAYALSTKYGEASASLSCSLYDEVAAAQGMALPPAEPARTATYQETQRAIIGTQKNRRNSVPQTVSRLVKQAGEDTILQNAQRDRALVAWIPHGDTCAFCIALASRGWEFASAKLMKNGHAQHIHANCDCTHAVTWDPFNTNYASYDPDRYREMYDNAEGRNSQQKINALRREFYAENRDEINAQKRSAYAKRIELNSSRAEEDDV